MKVLKRKTLDELKAIMPVLSETEQAMYNGGTFYFDLSGNELGKVGTGNDLKFIAQSDFNYYRDNNIEGAGVSFGSLNDAGQNKFIDDHTSLEFDIRTSIENGYDAALTTTGKLLIDENSSIWNNYYNALSTLEHEEYHYAHNHYITGNMTLVDKEIETYVAQINTSNFINSSYEYKKNHAECLYNYYQQRGDNITLSEVYRMVGI